MFTKLWCCLMFRSATLRMQTFMYLWPPLTNKMEQKERRDSKHCLVVDEDCGIPTSVVENHRAYYEAGPLAQSDPRSFLLSMSEYDKAQVYDVYGECQSFISISRATVGCLMVASNPGISTRRGHSRRGAREKVGNRQMTDFDLVHSI